MKYVLGIILAFVLILPSKSLAAPPPKISKYSNFFPIPWGVAVGGGPKMFSTGVDFYFGDLLKVYSVKTVNDHSDGSKNDRHSLFWMNRIRWIYDYENHQHGILFQPNLRYMWDYKGYLNTISVTVGPEIGWESKTGFEYGVSLRTGGAPSLFVGNYEAGYLVNSKRFYLTVSFAISGLPIMYIFNGYHG